jgi:hypothetical protein
MPTFSLFFNLKPWVIENVSSCWHFFLIFMNKFEYSRVVKRYSLKPWRYEYYKFMYRLGHSGEFEKILFRSLVALSALASGIFTLLIIFDF